MTLTFTQLIPVFLVFILYFAGLPERAALPLLPPLRSWMTATASCRSKILIGGYSFGFR